MRPRRTRYGKLIRDRIPEIIEAGGARAKVRRLSKKAYARALREKILEEARELCAARRREALLNELVDLQELVDASRRLLEIPPRSFRRKVEEKRRKRGGFRKRLYLEYTEAD